ncbi:MAG: hypothetical protein R3297_01025 [Desulfobulbales bacterium]|nr:hypothetical protein [Desulfobulbales bacterium]
MPGKEALITGRAHPGICRRADEVIPLAGIADADILVDTIIPTGVVQFNLENSGR